MIIGAATKAKEAAFRNELLEVKEEVMLKIYNIENYKISISEEFINLPKEDALKFDIDLKKEIIYWGQYEIGVTELTKEYAKNNWEYILNTEGVLENIYYIDENKKYLYDIKEDIVYKVEKTVIDKNIVHSIEELDDIKGVVNFDVISNNSDMIEEYDGISHFEPDLTGFLLENTSVMYYRQYTEVVDDVETLQEEFIKIPAKDYLNGGKKRVIEVSGNTYEFYNYTKNIWANILVENNGMSSWWVWIPRYAYSISGNNTLIEFIDLETEPEGYIVHSAFTTGNKKGIWVSKYEPIETINEVVDNYPYYLPDMTGFDPDNTYVEVYNTKTTLFEETKLKDIQDLDKFAKENKWFDYNAQIWANIKVHEPESDTTSWWVWIPRYAYSISGNNINIKFIDLNNKPLDGSKLTSNYKVHPTFSDNLKGIWVSKYEPVLKIGQVGATNNVNAPNLTGFNVDNTYIESFDQINNKFIEYPLRNVLGDNAVINDENVLEVADIDNSKINGIWYSYDKQIWANIKVHEPESDTTSWWVWIPRYAYSIVGNEISIKWLDPSGNTTDGSTLTSNYIPHSVFDIAEDGIWISKYEPINK